MKRLTQTKRALLGAGASLALIATISACTPVPNVPMAVPGEWCQQVGTLISDNAQYVTRCSNSNPVRFDIANNTSVPIPAQSIDTGTIATMSGDGSKIYDLQASPSGNYSLTRTQPAVSSTATVVTALPNSGHIWGLETNASGSVVLGKHFTYKTTTNTGDGSESIVIDLGRATPTVSPIAKFLGKQPGTAVIVNVSLDGNRVNSIYYLKTAPGAFRYHTYDVVTNTQTDGLIPAACSTSDFVRLEFSTVICSSPNAPIDTINGTSISTFNLTTKAMQNLTVFGSFRVIGDGSRMISMSPANGGTNQLILTKTDGSKTIIDAGDASTVMRGLGWPSASGTAITYTKRNAAGSPLLFAVSF